MSNLYRDMIGRRPSGPLRPSDTYSNESSSRTTGSIGTPYQSAPTSNPMGPSARPRSPIPRSPRPQNARLPGFGGIPSNASMGMGSPRSAGVSRPHTELGDNEYLGMDRGLNTSSSLRGTWSSDYRRNPTLLTEPCPMDNAPRGAVDYVSRTEGIPMWRSYPAERVDSDYIRRREADPNWSPRDSFMVRDQMERDGRWMPGNVRSRD